VCLQVDLNKAFHCVSGTAVLEEVAGQAIELLPWATTAYGQESILFFDGHQLLSAAGVQQGDPLGPLFFCMALHRVLHVFPQKALLNPWYLGDGLMHLPAGTLAHMVDQLVRPCVAIGLAVNPQKCLLWGQDRVADAVQGFGLPGLLDAGSLVRSIPGYWLLPGAGMRALDSPVEQPSTSTFRAAFVAARGQQLEAAIDLMGQTGDPAGNCTFCVTAWTLASCRFFRRARAQVITTCSWRAAGPC
jgi:hypothetical protein